MASPRRTQLLLALLPGLLIAANWRRLEEPRSAGSEAAVLVLLALAPLVARRAALRIALATFAALLAVGVAFDRSPLDARPFSEHDFFGPVASAFRAGFLSFYDVTIPFEPGPHPLMHGVLGIAIFGFTLAVVLAISFGRAIPAVLALVAGAAWPATLLGGGNELLRGGLILAGALVLLAGLSSRSGNAFARALPAAAAVLALSLVAATSPAVAKPEFLEWKQWDFYNRPQKPVGVRYVWNSNYGGIQFPKKVTTVLHVEAPPRSMYWRATTLDVFEGRRWIEYLEQMLPRGAGAPESDPLLPPGARDPGNWIQQRVTVEALRDNHLVGGSVPVGYRYDIGAIGEVRFAANGTAYVPRGIEQGDRYDVFSYSALPRPDALARSRADYPVEIRGGGYLDVALGITVPEFGAPGRHAEVERLLRENAFVLQPYADVYETARDVVGRPRNPYAAAIALETWFRRGGGFTYDEQPPPAVGRPPLADFVLRTKTGYCQHYAGAMALMLRYLGVPARVAAGFTSGRYDGERRRWTVTDHDAHTWVEVWFDGFGWLPFDPTPARGTLSAPYSISSQNFDISAASRLLGLAAAAVGGQDVFDIKLDRTFGEKGIVPDRGSRAAADARRDGGAGGGPGTPSLVERRGGSLLRLLALVLAAAAAAVVVAKVVLRRSRYLTRDPRRLAAACRRELADVLADQGVEVPPSATLRELATIVEERYRVDAQPFLAAVTSARFGRRDGADESARDARTELRLLERGLRAELSRGERVRGLLSLRSLGFSSS